MKQKNLGSIFLSLLIAGAVLLFARGAYLYWWKPKSPAAVSDSKTAAELKKIDAYDLTVLEKNAGSEDFVIKTLKRFTNQNTPETERIVKMYLNDPRPEVRAVALEVAGAYSNPEFVEIIKKEIVSDIRTVRMGALAGLARRPEEYRLEIFRWYWGRIQPDTDEYLFAKLCELKLTWSPAEKNKIKKDILARLNEPNIASRVSVLNELYIHIPSDGNLIDLGRVLLMKTEQDGPLSRVLHYERAYDINWLRENVSKFPIQESYDYQLVLLDYLKADCPPAWRVVLKSVKEKPNREVSDAEIKKFESEVKCR